MNSTARLVAAVLIGAVILGFLAWTPPAEAYEPLCFECAWFPFSGFECFDASGNGWPSCTVRTGTGSCHVYGGPCSGLTSIER